MNKKKEEPAILESLYVPLSNEMCMPKIDGVHGNTLICT